MEITRIEIPEIKLEWSNWYPWESFLIDSKNNPSGINVPSKPGVYEAKINNSESRLTIGKASNLRMRIKQGLIKGKIPHSAGTRIRKNELVSAIEIRWAITDRPACVEEELHKKHIEFFHNLPKYTMRT